MRIDYLNRTRLRTVERGQQRLRLEARFRTGQTAARCYIAYNVESQRRDYASLFTSLTHRSAKFGSVEIWWNLARFHVRDSRAGYWYGYVRNRQLLLNNVAVAMKLSHRFDESASPEHRTVVLLELEAWL